MAAVRRLIFSFVAVLILAGAVVAGQQPLPRLVGKQMNTSGTISSVQSDAVVLDVTKPKKDSLALFMNKDTTVEGDLKVGAKADVVYQKDDQGNLVAIKVHVNS